MEQEIIVVPESVIRLLEEEVKTCPQDSTTAQPFNLKFDPTTIAEYTEHGRRVDCTTVARAAEAGQLDFLKWCMVAGYSHCFDATVLGYAMHGSQVKIAEWLLSKDIIDWQCWHSPYRQDHLVKEAHLLGLDETLVARIPPCRHMI